MSEDVRSTTSLDERIGQRIRACRIARDVSQESLAEALGITFQQVQKYEAGVNRVSASRLQDIAYALETTPMEFFDPDFEEVGSEVQEALREPHVLRGLVKLSKLPAKVRKKAVEMIEALA